MVVVGEGSDFSFVCLASQRLSSKRSRLWGQTLHDFSHGCVDLQKDYPDKRSVGEPKRCNASRCLCKKAAHAPKKKKKKKFDFSRRGGDAFKTPSSPNPKTKPPRASGRRQKQTIPKRKQKQKGVPTISKAKSTSRINR